MPPDCWFCEDRPVATNHLGRMYLYVRAHPACRHCYELVESIECGDCRKRILDNAEAA